MSDVQDTQNNELLKSVEFDNDWYKKEYVDVASLGMAPAEHYLRYGRALGRLSNGSTQNCAQITQATPTILTDSEHANAFGLVYDSLRDYKSRVLSSESVLLSTPRVSVIITAHNAEQTIVRSVQSMLFQTWKNLEVIVVDDASNDGTWSILSDMVQQFKGSLRAIRLQSNLGTYVAKNIGILQATGEFVFFQDSDDYSHPERVAIQAAHLALNPSVQANRTKYCRFDPDTGLVIPISGHQSRLGLITLAVRRTLFDRVGFFDPVRKAGDDEWFERARTVVGREHFVNLDVAMYIAELRQNSLAQDLFVTDQHGGVFQRLAGDRAEYVKLYTARHVALGKDAKGLREQSPPIPMRAPQWVPDTLAAVSKKRLPVYATMCTIPAREKALRRAIDSIIDQIDHLYLYLDKYEKAPNFLAKDTRITVMRSQDFSRDFRDNAKFIPYNRLKQDNSDFIFLTLDDDIKYPYDYVHHQLQVSESFNRKCVTGVHGVIYDDYPEQYFDRRIVYHYRKDALRRPVLVNGLGTGTTMFHSSCFDSINPHDWERGGMVDIYFSIQARLNNVPMVCVNRTKSWLMDLDEMENGPTLYDEFKSKDKLIVNALAPHQPWGAQAISQVVETLSAAERHKLSNCMPAFSDDLSLSFVLLRYRG